MAKKELPRIPKIWKGYFQGTNRGFLTAHVSQNNQDIQCKAVIYEQEFGPSKAVFTGKLSGVHADLRLIHFRSSAEITAVTGQLILDFDPDFQSAKGNWNTDIGTQGSCEIQAVNISPIRWWCHLLWQFVFHYAPALFAIFYLVLLVLDTSGIIHLSYPALFLILIPMLYIYRAYLLELVQTFRIRKAGPIEFEQSQVSEHTLRWISQQVQENLYFSFLHSFFVPRTKFALLWLEQKPWVTRQEFNNFATSNWCCEK